MKTKLCTFLLLLNSVSLTTNVIAQPHLEDKYVQRETMSASKAQNMREQFLNAEKLAKTAPLQTFVSAIKGLEQYPLYPYLWYLRYKDNLSLVTSAMLGNFESRYPTFSYHEELRRSFVHQLWLQKNYAEVIEAYKPTTNLNTRCEYIHAKYELQPSKDVLKAFIPIWLEGKSEPGACQLLFEHSISMGLITPELRWKQIKKVLANNNHNYARVLAANMSTVDRQFVEMWIKVLNQPDLVTNGWVLEINHPMVTSMLASGIIKMANSDPNQAVEAWDHLKGIYEFSKKDVVDIKNKIAVGLTQKNSPLANAWLKKAIELEPSEQILNISIAQSLKRSDWQNVFGAISLMPKALQESERALYWKARALYQLGQSLEAKRIYRILAKKKTYYGLLASERLGNSLDLKQDPFSYTDALEKKIKHHPSVLAALEWVALSRRAQANKEWSFGVSQMNEAESLAAAKFAQDIYEYNWAISAVSKLGNKLHTHFKYPLAHYSTVIKEASRQSIHPAWIFAITKQESAFSPRALSRVGASGLMQLMPNTAKEVAKKQSIAFSHQSELFDVDLNLKLGSAYLNSVLNIFNGNHILATAAYNAGPNRVKQWLPPKELPADIWIETIPYNETRDYVKNVITFMQIYQHLLGEKPSLGAYMKDIYSKE